MTDPTGESRFWPADNPAATLHITQLQGIISRLAGNSASCKTWCFTLVAAMIGLAGATHAPQVVSAALVPVLIFGITDVLYLGTEIAYRRLYQQVVEAMRDGSYGRPMVYEARAPVSVGCIFVAIRSWSIIPYYAFIVFYVIAVTAGWPVLLAVASK
jgi:hypothetical protein